MKKIFLLAATASFLLPVTMPQKQKQQPLQKNETYPQQTVQTTVLILHLQLPGLEQSPQASIRAYLK